MQVRCRILDVVMLVLGGTAFRSEYGTAVDTREISTGKLIVSLCVPLCPFAFSDCSLLTPKYYFAVFGKAVEVDVFAFLYGRRLLLAPCISLVEHKSSVFNVFFGMLSCVGAERHGHECSSIPVVTHPIPVLRSGVLIRRRAALRNRQRRADDAMTAISLDIALLVSAANRGHLDGDATDDPFGKLQVRTRTSIIRQPRVHR